MSKSHQQIRQLTTKEVLRMSSDEIIEYVHFERERLKASDDYIWDEISMDLKKQIADSVISERNKPSDFRHTFSGDEWIINITITYVFTFGLIWLVFYNLMENKFNAMQLITVAYGVASVLITAAFLHLAKKGERNYLDAVNSLNHIQEARSTHIYRKGFKDYSSEPIYGIKDDD